MKKLRLTTGQVETGEPTMGTAPWTAKCEFQMKCHKNREVDLSLQFNPLLAGLSTTGGPQPVPCGWIGNNNNKMSELCELSYGLTTWEIVLEARCKFRAQWLFAPIPRWVGNTVLLWDCLSEKAKLNNAKTFYWKVVAGDSYFTLFFFLLKCRFQDYKWSKGKAGSGQVSDT